MTVQINGNETYKITTGSYRLRKLSELIIDHLRLNEKTGDSDYLNIPVTKDEWEFILERIKDW